MTSSCLPHFCPKIAFSQSHLCTFPSFSCSIALPDSFVVFVIRQTRSAYNRSPSSGPSVYQSSLSSFPLACSPCLIQIRLPHSLERIISRPRIAHPSPQLDNKRRFRSKRGGWSINPRVVSSYPLHCSYTHSISIDPDFGVLINTTYTLLRHAFQGVSTWPWPGQGPRYQARLSPGDGSREDH